MNLASRKTVLFALLLTLLFSAGYFVWAHTGTPPLREKPIGGERDVHGCLTPAGYAYDEEVGACIRAFDMTPDIKRAAALAVQSVGRGYVLTVVSFNSYEEPNAYDIMLERGAERTAQTVYIRDGVATSTPH